VVQNPAYKFGLVMLGGFGVLALAGDIEHHLMHHSGAKFGGFIYYEVLQCDTKTPLALSPWVMSS